MRRRQSLHQLAAAKLLSPFRRQMDLVSARRERRKDRLVITEIREVTRHEQDLHGFDEARRQGRGRPVSASHARSSAGVTPSRRSATSA